jgi:zinc D-Ala-D-Ala carboxypeptidase
MDPKFYMQRVQEAHRQLGIPADFLHSCKLPLCCEPAQLVETEPDYLQRHRQLTPAAFDAWTRMKQAARDEGLEIFLVSAYRSLDYQQDLIARKLASGQALNHILTVNAAPGFSEHHTGRAVDIGTSNCEVLVEEFEKTQAFAWLAANAVRFNFYMTYPRGNAMAISYEPWHWCFVA